MGNQNNGSFPVGFSWPDVNVPENGKVTLLYQILNSGHKNHVELERALLNVGRDQLPSAEGNDWLKEVAKVLLEHTVKFVVADCDGPIAPPGGRRVVWNDFELKGVAPGTTSEETINERGNDSPPGCGRNSHYIVHVSVTA
jgi:hypothetical protein